ncbi:MAG: hypothetical protein R3F59_12075 [Myxococcota bacterium]
MRAALVLFALPALSLVACSGGGKDGCTAPAEGAWTMDGSCFGMEMSASVALDADGCSFTFSDWDMAMDVPAGGTVTGTDVALTGDGWDDCTGTTDGATISGTCGDGCTFDMAAQ